MLRTPVNFYNPMPCVGFSIVSKGRVDNALVAGVENEGQLVDRRLRVASGFGKLSAAFLLRRAIDMYTGL